MGEHAAVGRSGYRLWGMTSSAEWDLGAATALEAEAIGEPGQRRFRLRVTAGDVTAAIWCEKEQVNSLATAVQQILARHRRDEERRRPIALDLIGFPLTPTHEFQAGRIALGYDEDAHTLTLYATDIDAQSDRPTLRVDFSREIARAFTVQAELAVAGGRPSCPLCKQPLEGDAHLCPQTNGHGDSSLAGIGPPEF